MRVVIKRGLCMLLTAALAAGGIQSPVSALNVDRTQIVEDGELVDSTEKFMLALQQHKSPIVIAPDQVITIGEEVDTDKRMLPVKIPADTVIRGTGNSSINSRSPIQLEGDVCFQDIELTFSSSQSLGSVAHREIFLAGHGLTFDNVATYLKGGGSLGELGGTEKELLPTVFAGGYTNTQIGDSASLTVRNSNEKTMFQAVYMGHGAESDNKVPYEGAVIVDLDAGATVRDQVDVSRNSKAEITISGGENENGKAVKFLGNDNAVLTLSGCKLENADVENVGNLVVQDRAALATQTGTYGNVTLKQGGCLDIDAVEAVLISGNLTGGGQAQEENGILVVDQNSSVRIMGNVTGTTRFQTGSRLFPSGLDVGRPYITADEGKASFNNFILPDRNIENGYQLDYEKGIWSVSRESQGEIKEVGEIDIVSSPSDVVLSQIMGNEDGTIPNENVFFEIVWKDTKGNEFGTDEVEELGLYQFDYIFMIKSDYWESDEPEIQEKTDWGNAISLMSSQDHPGKYFLEAFEGAKTGEYTVLFCSDYCSEALEAVRDVKALKHLVKAEKKVAFWDKAPEQRPTAAPTAEPTAAPTALPSTNPTVEPEPSLTAAPTKEPEPIETLAPATTAKPGETQRPVPPGEESAAPTDKPESSSTAEPTRPPEPIKTLAPAATAKPGETQHPIPPGEESAAPTKEPEASSTAAPTGPPEPIKTLAPVTTAKPGEESAAPTKEPEPPSTAAPTGPPEPSSTAAPTETPIAPVHIHKYETVIIRAAIEKDGERIVRCECGQIKEKQTICRPQKVALSSGSLVYTGKERKLSVRIIDSNGMEIDSKNYVLKYGNNVNVGKASVTVIFRGDYEGSMTAYFDIVPKSIGSFRLVRRPKGIFVKWKKQRKQTTGYEIQYSTSKKITGKTAKTVIVKNNKVVSKMLSIKKKRKKYYVRIRTFKVVKVNGKPQKFYSGWTKVRSVK